mmetsp:Transcript_98930/g.174534  ORF Transcript_98930/g.174534 Transcript_98930/m.174534 type:complete len:135 (+) Transcript_98930:35-439(+)
MRSLSIRTATIMKVSAHFIPILRCLFAGIVVSMEEWSWYQRMAITTTLDVHVTPTPMCPSLEIADLLARQSGLQHKEDCRSPACRTIQALKSFLANTAARLASLKISKRRASITAATAHCFHRRMWPHANTVEL